MIEKSIGKLDCLNYNDNGIIKLCKEYLNGTRHISWLTYEKNEIKLKGISTCNRDGYDKALYHLIELCEVKMHHTNAIEVCKVQYNLIMHNIKEIEKTEHLLPKR